MVADFFFLKCQMLAILEVIAKKNKWQDLDDFAVLFGEGFEF